jgi:hypothetical protein
LLVILVKLCITVPDDLTHFVRFCFATVPKGVIPATGFHCRARVPSLLTILETQCGKEDLLDGVLGHKEDRQGTERMSRQSRWQEERRRKGQCSLCGRPRPPESKDLCVECAVKRRERIRQRRGSKVRYTNAKSYKLAAAPRKRRRGRPSTYVEGSTGAIGGDSRSGKLKGRAS